MSSRAEQKATARERAAEVRAQQARSERLRRLAIAGVVTALVLIVVIALVATKLLGGGSGSGSAAPKAGQASTQLVKTLSGVPSSAFDTVGKGTAQNPPTAIKAPRLTKDGKPRILYVGAEFCPYCAAERWALATALARFGTISHLRTTHSSATDQPASVPTLSFHQFGYSSDALSFTGVEQTTNQPQGTGYKPLDSLTKSDDALVKKYDAEPYISGGGGIPFIDIGGRFVSSGATYDPSILLGKSHQQIADAVKDPSSDIGQAVLGSANVFTAAICQVTKGQPAAVCSSKGVKAAASALGGQ